VAGNALDVPHELRIFNMRSPQPEDTPQVCPFAFGMSGRMSGGWSMVLIPRCWVCDAERSDAGARAKQCGACKLAIYCSRECSRADWSRHKPVCRLVAASVQTTE
jgi:hypothetical protein